MPLLQEVTPKRDFSEREKMKVENEETPIKTPLTSVGYPSFPNPAMFTPSQLIMASQLMAASGLSITANPAFFHPGLLPLAWPANSPPSPPTSNEQLSPALKSRKLMTNLNNNNNNNNVVTSSSTEVRKRKSTWKSSDEETTTTTTMSALMPLSSPTSSASPPSSTDAKDTNRDKQFTCGVCNRSFGYKHVLQNHERTHTGEKPFECTECHKRFTRDHHLKTHMRLHTGERPYHCDHCDRQFVQVANLRRHLRVHTGERPYGCDQCTAKFSDSNQLKAHVLIHTNEKPFACERCQSRFRRRHHLLHHKCGGGVDKEMTPESDEPEDELRRNKRFLHPPTTPLITLPLHVALPEQTEPEDLSMSTGLHSHSSSGDSPSLSTSPSVKEDLDEEDIESAAIFLQRRPTTNNNQRHS